MQGEKDIDVKEIKRLKEYIFTLMGLEMQLKRDPNDQPQQQEAKNKSLRLLQHRVDVMDEGTQTGKMACAKCVNHEKTHRELKERISSLDSGLKTQKKIPRKGNQATERLQQ